MDNKEYIENGLLDKYEFYNYGHALEILHNAFPREWKELQECFRKLTLSLADIKKSGGNESPIPKKFDDVLYPYGWREIRISGDLIVKKYPRQTAQRRGRFADEPFIEACSQEPRIELFARGIRKGWDMWGNQATADYESTWETYSNHTTAQVK